VLAALLSRQYFSGAVVVQVEPRLCTLLSIGDEATTPPGYMAGVTYDGLGREVLEALLDAQAPHDAAVFCARRGGVLHAAQRSDDSALASELWRGAVSDVALAATEALLAHSHPPLRPRHGYLDRAATLATLALAQQVLASHAGPFDKGSFLERAVLASPRDPAPAKNLAYWLEQRGRPADAARALEAASAAFPGDVGLWLQRASLCPPHFESLEEAGATHAALVAHLDDLIAALAADGRRASKRRNGGIVSDGDNEGDDSGGVGGGTGGTGGNGGDGGDGLAVANDVGYLGSPLRLVGALPIAWPYLGFQMRPLHARLAAAYRLAAPDAGLDEVLVRRPARPAAVGAACSAAAAAVTAAQGPDASASSQVGSARVQRVPDSISVSLQRTATVLPPPLLAAAPVAAPAGPKSAAPPSTVTTLMGSGASGCSRRFALRASAPRRRMVVGVVGEAQENTSPGVLAHGWLAERLPAGRFEVVWFELEGTATAFSAAMRRRAAGRTVVLREGPSQPRAPGAAAAAQELNKRQRCGVFAGGGGGGGDDSGGYDDKNDNDDEDDDGWSDPLFVARRAVAAQRCDVLLYLAIGLTPFTFLLAQVRSAPRGVVCTVLAGTRH